MSIDYYWGLLADGQRIEAFRRAIAQVVGPGDRVLEVGAGLGTYSFFAADSDAAIVWGVEGSPVVNLARAIARLNGYADRVKFIDGWIPEVELPDRADVLIFEDFPARLMDPNRQLLLQRVYDDYLVDSARVIPGAAVVRAALCDSAPPRRGPVAGAFGIDWSPCLDYLNNTPLAVEIDPASLAAEPAVISRFAMKPAPGPAELCGEATWTLPGAKTLAGIALWFDLELAPGEWISNAPGDESSWGQLFLTLENPVEVNAGEAVTVVAGPETAADGLPGWLKWELRTANDRSGGHEFKAAPASLSELAHWSDGARLQLNARGRVLAGTLSLADGTRSLRGIAEAVQKMLGSDDTELTLRVVSGLLEGMIKNVDTS